MSATAQQQAAIAARGDVLVAAGAGTGKTSTVTERCLQLVIHEGCRLDEILMVTFTELAAAEMRERLRRRFNERLAEEPDDSPLALRLSEEVALLETAPISTLHSFCLDLVRRNFHTLGLDPQFTVLDEAQTKPLLHGVLDELFERHYTNPDSPVRELVRSHGSGREDAIRQLVLSLHRHTQALANPEAWFARQFVTLADPEPTAWRQILLEALRDWAELWFEALAGAADAAPNIATARAALGALCKSPTAISLAATSLEKILATDEPDQWVRGTKTKVRKPVESFYADAEFLAELVRDDAIALAEDWTTARGPLKTLLELAHEFTAEFTKAKRELGGIDFADQEQLALRLLYDERGAPSPVALACREQFRFVFVDECQDINAAQDAILRAVSRAGRAANRFLVGDVKQSIYRFRLADPRIFQNYQTQWSADQKQDSRVLPLSENFRSREGLLNFINPLFRELMRPVIGGLHYGANAELKFGAPEMRPALSVTVDATPRVELHVIKKESSAEAVDEGSEGGKLGELADLQSTEREARLIARRLKALKDSGHQIWNRDTKQFQAVEYRDMVVLMRSAAGRAEVFAKAFHQTGVPLYAERAGFLDSLEITDLLSLLRLLDNPLQDVPLLTVLHSPLVGLSPTELAEVLLAQPRGLIWFALWRYAEDETDGAKKAKAFLAQYAGWRELTRHSSLTHCLETALSETHYEALLLAGERGEARAANVRRLVELARRFDPYQREGLFRFLKFIAEQEESEVRHQPAALNSENAVRLMTVHASKGLEFPVVALAGLGTKFNLRELSGDILFNEDLGLCPKLVAPGSRRRYPSIAHWAATQRERRALLGEEMRLLYVALTRARDTLLLTGTASRKDEPERWRAVADVTDLALLRAGTPLEWLRLWFTNAVTATEWTGDSEGSNGLLQWRFYDAQDESFAIHEAATQTPAEPLVKLPSAEVLSELQSRLAFRYPNKAATVEPAKTSVSVLRRRANERDEEARTWFPAKRTARRPGATSGQTGKPSPTEIGNAHHAFMQFVELSRVGGELELRAEAESMRIAGDLSVEEIGVLDFAALSAFWQSPVGKSFRLFGETEVHRELPFTARMSTADLRALNLPLANPALGDEEFVVIQGVVDLAAIREREIWLLDFKTDHVRSAAEVAARVEHYSPQVKLYSLALARIYRRPVTRCWLHFFATGKTETVALA